MSNMERTLSRQEASDAVSDLGWRYLLGTLCTSVPVTSLSRAAEVTGVAVAACAAQADGHLRADVRADRVVLSLQSLDRAALTDCDTDLAHRVTAAVGGIGLRTEPDLAGGARRSVQLLEIAIDALDIPAIRPFWKAVLGYAAEPGADGPTDPLVDPVGQGPALWFQQMDRPRPQRNRVHFDMCVPHDEATRRIRSALAAGGRLLSDDRAPAFWVLADVEGNEVCVTTWQGRDQPRPSGTFDSQDQED
jgi:4a-hydroxytetrahydrobiopterin dehydratase